MCLFWKMWGTLVSLESQISFKFYISFNIGHVISPQRVSLYIPTHCTDYIDLCRIISLYRNNIYDAFAGFFIVIFNLCIIECFGVGNWARDQSTTNQIIYILYSE